MRIGWAGLRVGFRQMSDRTTNRQACAAVAGLVCCAISFCSPVRAQLGESCTATILNRTVQVDSNGTFSISNVPVPPGAFRARIVCESGQGAGRAQSQFVSGEPNGVTSLGTISFTEEDPIPVSLDVASPASTLTQSAPGAQLTTTGKLVGGTSIDLTLAASGTFYLSSNPGIATVSSDGFVNASSSGNVLVTATNEGVIATIALAVELTDDEDGDGLPDDFEETNAFNTGGANLSRLPEAVANASSSLPGWPASRAIDGGRGTSWFTAVGDAANLGSSPFIEVLLQQDAGVAQVRMFGNREAANGLDFFAGIFQAFNGAGAEVFNSGVVQLPAPSRDVSVPVDLDGIRRVRFTATDDESNEPGLAEIQLISMPGGPGLDLNDPTDAALDFDFDNLPNLQEFDLGTNIFVEDTDGDGSDDDEEVIIGSNPLLADTDNDGLLDGEELSPTADSDGDGLINVLDSDSDNDGLPDGLEVRLGLSPLTSDSDSDTIPDGSEDSDSDGLTNIDEFLDGITDPGNPDEDQDGLLDGEEVTPGVDGFVTDPLDADTDDDGLPDGLESRVGLDPTDPSDGVGDIVIRSANGVLPTGALDGRSIRLESSTITMNGLNRFTALELVGSTVTHDAGTATSESRLEIEVTGDVTVDVDSVIDVSGRGYIANRTLGNAIGSSSINGGSYGGLGGRANTSAGRNDVYGDFRDPNELGSGGASASGGGLVRITAGRLTLDGDLLANAGAVDSNRCGAGSGGGVRLEVGVLEGAGLIHARGGISTPGGCGGGGGGRIAVYYDDMSGFSGPMDARGGQSNGPTSGGAGTIYLRSSVQTNGDLIVNNRSVTNTPAGSTPLRSVGAGLSEVLTATMLTDTTRVFPEPNASTGALGLIGLELNPNTAQADPQQTFRITGNTDTELVTVPDLTTVAVAGDEYIGVYTFDNLTVTGTASAEADDECFILGVLDTSGGTLVCANIP